MCCNWWNTDYLNQKWEYFINTSNTKSVVCCPMRWSLRIAAIQCVSDCTLMVSDVSWLLLYKLPEDAKSISLFLSVVRSFIDVSLLSLLFYRPETSLFVSHDTEYVGWIVICCFISIKMISAQGCYVAKNTKDKWAYFCIAFAGRDEYNNTIDFDNDTTMAIIYNEGLRKKLFKPLFMTHNGIQHQK